MFQGRPCVPAKAGTHLLPVQDDAVRRWAPAFAGAHSNIVKTVIFYRFSAARRDINIAARVACRAKLGNSTVSSGPWSPRSEEHTSELQSLMRISYAVFCLNKKKTKYQPIH